MRISSGAGTTQDKLNFYCYINTVEIVITSEHPTIQCIDDLVIHQFDREMANFSIGLSHELMVEILIKIFRVKIARRGYNIYIYKRHHGISADLLVRKLGIVIYKAKLTLQSTTQDNFKLSLKPLTWRYRIYLMLQRLY